MKQTGIYKIQSISCPERIYIGSAIDIDRRYYIHLRNLKMGKHNPKIQHHYNKYGVDDLKLSVIEQFEFSSKEHILNREQYYLDLLKPYFNGSPTACSPLGCKRTEDQRIRMNNSHKGTKGHKGWNKGKGRLRKWIDISETEIHNKIQEAFLLHQKWISEQRM